MPHLAPKIRDDLEYFEQVMDGEDIVLVRDPIRGTYMKFNPLQAAMLKALDGKRKPDDISALLSEQFEVEIPPAAAERFVTRARDLMLLDVTSYDATSDAARRQLRVELRKQGFRVREARADVPARPLSAEGMLFAEALRQIDLGHPRAAAGYLAKILERNPDNARAKQLYDVVQTAYIKASGGMSDWPTIVLFNPNRLLKYLSRTIGGFVFSSKGAIALLLYFTLGIYAYTTVSFSSPLSTFDVAFAIVLYVSLSFIHELGHGLACQHFGGNVTEVGFTFFFYIRPAAFCDTSSSYTISDRRQKLIVQLAGTCASLTVLSTSSILLALMYPSLPIYNGLALEVLIDSTFVFVTLVPFMKFDGYYAICDYIGFPNMRDRSFKVTHAWLSKSLLGLERPAEEVPPRTKKLLIAYGLASFAFTVWFVYLAYSHMLAWVVERFRIVGLIFACLLTIYGFRKITLRPLWNGLRTIVRERRTIFTPRRTLALGLIATLAIGPWFMSWPVLVDGSFVLVPRERAVVRAQVSGRIDQLLVREGMRVTRGQPLALLTNETLRSRITLVEATLDATEHELEAVRRGARPEELDVARMHAAEARAAMERSASEADTAARLAGARLGTQSGADLARAQVAAQSGQAGAAEWNVSLLEHGPRDADVKVAQAEVDQLRAELARLRDDYARLTVRSPVDGVVVTPHVEDRIQSLLAPGDEVVEVDDVNGVVAEIELAPGEPIGTIAAGDDVTLRITGVPHGEIKTKLARIRERAETKNHALVVVTAPFSTDHPIGGLGGHARIYGTERSLAYAHLYLPLLRVINVELWAL